MATKIDAWGIEIKTSAAAEKRAQQAALAEQRCLIRMAFDRVRYREKEIAHWLAGGLSGRNVVTEDMLKVAREIISKVR